MIPSPMFVPVSLFAVANPATMEMGVLVERRSELMALQRFCKSCICTGLPVPDTTLIFFIPAMLLSFYSILDVKGEERVDVCDKLVVCL